MQPLLRASCLALLLLSGGPAACKRHAPSTAPAAATSSSPARARIASPTWTNLGIADTRLRGTGEPQPFQESGRTMAVRADPRDPAVVYVATVGGAWRSRDFTSSSPTWTLLTGDFESAPVSAIDLDPSNPDHVVVGTGDAFSIPRTGGGVVARSDDGGATWGAKVTLAGTNARGERVASGSVRDVAFDPSNASVVLVAAEHGLFRSKDGGASFDLVDLPNADGAAREDEMWSLAWLGADVWLASGVEECAHCPGGCGQGLGVGEGPAPACASAQLGDIWRSADGGATWTSARAAKAMPLHAGERGLARMTLAAGDTSAPSKTVVFAMVAGAGGSATVDVFRSTDGGRTFQSAWGSFVGTADCKTPDVGDGQSYYNQAIAVDPTDANQVFVGGMTCAMRSMNALSKSPTWQPAAQSVVIRDKCTVPYVHGDLHAARLTKTPAGVRLLLGDDGGIDVAAHPFAAEPCDAGWSHPDRTLTNQLVQNLGSGDPADGNGGIVLAGLQDIGSRLRDGADPVWDLVRTGDGHGIAIVKGARGEIWWNGDGVTREYCKPAAQDCHRMASWTKSAPDALERGDAVNAHLTSPITIDPDGAVLAGTSHNVYKVDFSAAWKRITPASFPYSIVRLVASPTTTGLYGAVLREGRCAVTSDGDGPSPHWDVSVAVGASSDTSAPSVGMAFPPRTAAGAKPGDVYLCGRAPSRDEDGSAPSLFITRDRGKTFAPLQGDLPRLAVYVVAYDPTDDTGSSIYAANGVGVYRTTDGGASWARYGAALPSVPVTDLFVSKRGDLLRAGTWGRGVWELLPFG